MHLFIKIKFSKLLAPKIFSSCFKKASDKALQLYDS